MANKNSLTTYYKVSQAQQDYYDPVAVLPGSTTKGITSLYCFIAKNDDWPDNIPEDPQLTQKYIKNIYSNIFAVKKITSENVRLVIPRFDWTTNLIYDYYRDDVNMHVMDNNLQLIYKFYVRNKYNQIFKCLWNNNGNVTTDEPFFQPGSYGTNNIFKGNDGYKWKYLYTIDGKSVQSFIDSSWITVPITLIPGLVYSGQTLDPIETSAGIGNIDVINVVNGGNNYDAGNNIIQVVITGDGTGATAIVEEENGSITDIIVTNTGTGYTYANVEIFSVVGSNCTAIAPVSPIGGHGYDSCSELGVCHVMYSIEFNSSENSLIPIDILYNQIGLIYNPLSKSTYPHFADDSIYKTTTDLVVAPGFGVYTSGEWIYQGNSFEDNTFKAKILSFEPETNIISLINIKGNLTLNASVFGNTSKTTRTLMLISSPDFIKHSGYISYIENRDSVERSTDGIEQFKFVLGY